MLITHGTPITYCIKGFDPHHNEETLLNFEQRNPYYVTFQR